MEWRFGYQFKEKWDQHLGWVGNMFDFVTKSSEGFEKVFSLYLVYGIMAKTL